MREKLFIIAEDRKDWKKSLPQAILPPGKRPFFSAQRIVDNTRNAAMQIKKILSSIKSDQEELPEYPDSEIFARLPNTFQLIETMIEQFSRFETYSAEVETVQNSGMTFQQWQDLTPLDEAGGQERKLYYIPLLPTIDH
jgi:hypothetical protein